MTSFEKKMAGLLGLLVFSALFYFIYASMNLAPDAPEPDDAAFGDYDYTIEGEPVADEAEAAVKTPTPPAPVAPPPSKK
ncbi:MAG: hypothetical protein IPO76_02535 [Elusimicrobia bacterium]|jgi:hypothetical protein|nr:hypothetical protein [Elusimicrobiota bacterium]MBK7207516.1 hypothetical protein [Elusimicrobiota bacterium]MBK7544286.1 hypothetical protein [Elusimicrobiota bacterium]MBK7573808.1 hypothetical protein [Elusimicrobiota bacterium]MBK7689406.1 hypothetical protein [Elusimicrobiota bacterium]